MLKDKPSKEPDYVSNGRTYIWFNELVMLNWENKLIKLILCEKSSKLRTHAGERYVGFPCSGCPACLESNYSDCTKHFLADHIQDAYKRWSIKTFEDIVLGSNDKE